MTPSSHRPGWSMPTDHEEHFRAVGGPNDSATFQWSDQVALLHEAVLAFRARQALTGEAS